MTNKIRSFQLLVQRHLDNQLSEQEEEEFYVLIQQEEYRLLLQQVIDEQFQGAQVAGPSIHPDRLEQIRNQILASKQARRVRLFTLRRIVAAAAVLIGITGSVYFWSVSRPEPSLTQVKPTSSAHIGPGRNGAVLTLADGTKVVLDSLGNGVVATQHGARAVLQDGQLTYQATDDGVKSIAYNTMATPKGRQFHVRLPDGTQVWLNAASTITYPTVFNHKRREVNITGEVYFEVAKKEKQPFMVKVNEHTQVEVMGTHFNVNAYDDGGSIKTTLLEGKVKVANGNRLNSEVILQPGEQAVLTPHSPPAINHSPDISQVMAWKNGLFNFNGNDLRSAINEIGRWYDLEVIYESTPEPRQIVGEIERNLTLEQVMTVLKKLNINYRIDGRKLIITK